MAHFDAAGTDYDVYRVRQPATHRHPKRWVRSAWYGRTWQAEWEVGWCGWCPRAWTERGIHRKARRWIRQGRPTVGYCRRRRWARQHFTRRND